MARLMTLVRWRLAGDPEVLPGKLPRRFHRLGATGGEEDAVEVARRVAGDPLGQLDGARVRVGPQREVGERLGLLGAGLGQLGPAVAELRGEEAREAVEVALAVLVPDPRAFAAHDDGHLVVRCRRPCG